MEIALVLGLVALAVILFSVERIPIEVTALLILSVLLVTRTLKPDQAFAGFGSDTVIMIAGLFVLTAALLRTGVVDNIGRFMSRGNVSPNVLAIFVMVTVTTLSAFISNTAATAVFVPLVIGLARRAKISPSKLLMPLAFASILSSSVTLISSSTNIVISGLLPRYRMEPIGMFEMAPIGIPITIAGLIYMIVIGMKLLPAHADEPLAEEYHLRDYLTEVLILPTSPLIGKTLRDSKLSEKDLFTVGILRDKQRILSPSPRETLQIGDILLVEGGAEDILSIKDTSGLEIKPDFKLADDPFQSEEIKLAEVLVMPNSKMRGETLKRARFRELYGLVVLAMNRQGITLRTKISQTPMKIGDVLLVQGKEEDIQRLSAEGFSILSDISSLRPRSPKAGMAIAIFVISVALGTFKVLTFPTAMLVGTVLMFLSRSITPEEAYTAIEWRILILIGSMIALGLAMEESGAAKFLADLIIDHTGSLGPMAVLGSFFVLTVLLTQPMSNQAAALVLLPVAIQTAISMQLNPRTFAMVIAVAASCSYLTPLEPSCILVYGPGRYKFTDFLRVGAALTVVIFILSMILIPKFWPLHN